MQLVLTPKLGFDVEAYIWVYKLYSIIFRWIVARSNHDPDRLSIHFSGPNRSKEPYTEYNRRKQLPNR